MHTTGREKPKYDAGGTEGFRYSTGETQGGFRFEYHTNFSSSFNKIFSEVLYFLLILFSCLVIMSLLNTEFLLNNADL